MTLENEYLRKLFEEAEDYRNNLKVPIEMVKRHRKLPPDSEDISLNIALKPREGHYHEQSQTIMAGIDPGHLGSIINEQLNLPDALFIDEDAATMTKARIVSLIADLFGCDLLFTDENDELQNNDESVRSTRRDS